MGSSKKHKEKKDKKKHKKRSRSREREKDGHRKSHKSSSRKERKRSITPEIDSGDEKRRRIADEEASNRDFEMHIEEKPLVCYREPSPDDLFDIDKLLDSKLGEKNDTVVDRAVKKRNRESAIEEFKRRQNLSICTKDPIEIVTTNERVIENYSHTEADATIVGRALKKRDRESAIEEFKRRQNISNKDSIERVTNEPVTENYIHTEIDATIVDRALKKRHRESAIEEFKRRQNICNKDPIERVTNEPVTENYSHTEFDATIVDRALKKRNRENAIEEFKRRQNIANKDQMGRVTNEPATENYSHTEVDATIVDRALKKRNRESAIEEFKRRQNISNKDQIERVMHERITEKYSHTEVKPPISPVPESFQKDVGIPFLTDEPEILPEIKQEPPDTYTEEYAEERTEPQLSLSISETNKLRAKLGLKPLDVGNEIPERTEPQRTEQLSLSIAETNKLRAKLGLKPLEVGSEIPGLSDENAEKEPTKKPEVFVKTENISEVKRHEVLRERLKVMKEKRSIEEKLKKTKGVADSDSEDESAADWVVKHQKVVQEKEKAELRAKMLEEMDEEFGVGALIEEEFKNKAYTSKHLKGLTIAHDVDSFKEGTPIILTLKDKGVLDEEEDILENVNIVDLEKSVKNVENKKKKPDYRPYEEPEFDEFGILQKKSVLSKYDEEIEGEKKKTFKIGTETAPSYTTREQELELIRMKLKQQNKISLEMPELKIANEYYTPADMVQFKKPKKKKKARKTAMLKADDLLTDEIDGTSDLGSRKRRKISDDVPYTSDLHDTDNMDVVSEDSNMSNIIIEEDEAEKELYSALNKAKKLKQRKVMNTAPEKVIEILHKTSSACDSTADAKAANIELNSVAEFCRTLGDIPTYGMSGNRDEEADEMMDLEREIMEEKQKQELDAQNRGAWNEVDIDEKPAEISVRENEPILEEEPDINHGIAGALKLAMKKGYLDKDGKKAAGAPKTSQLQAQSYTIEEKFYEDDKFGKRDRYTGPIQEFREKSNYKPDVKLEYIDDSGRLLTAKEAFRYLSHKFHGKGPGKNKVDKRMKKLEQETRLKQMSSTDTPLNTVKLLQAKQKETQSPYIVLSGGNKTLTQTMISKTKM